MTTHFFSSSARRAIVFIPVLVFISAGVFAQNTTVGGTVTESSGATLPGVTILEKGTSNSSITDIDGKFSINVPPDAVLIATFIGFETVEVPVETRTSLSIVLKQGVKSLDEVVVIGYGSTTQKEVTGAVTSLKVEDFNKGSYTDPLGMISGKVAGLSITQPNGADPRAKYELLLRGSNSLTAGQSPLIIIDGVIGADLNNVNFQDVASFDILKDGSAAAIYGTRGTNGVIIITTKSARAGKPVLEYSSQASVQVNPRMVKNLNASEFTEAIEKYNPEKDNPQNLMGANTNWFKAVTRDMPVGTQQNLALSGGTDNTTYRTSITYSTSQGLQKNNNSNKLLLKANIHQKALDKKLDLDFNITSTTSSYKPANYEIFHQAFIQNPTQPIYDPTNTQYGGYSYLHNITDYYNPVAMLNERTQDGKYSNLMASLKATIKITSDLSWSNFVATNHSTTEENSYETKYYPSIIGQNGQAEIDNSETNSSQFESTLNFNKPIGDHNLQAVAGYSFQNFEDHSNYLSNGNFDTDLFGVNNIGAGSYLRAGTADLGSDKETSKLISLFGRAMYNYKEKYLVSVSVRREGSSKFGINNKWGTFPAVSVGWRIHEETFLQGVSWISELKLRAGYGVTGNQDFSPYQSLVKLNTGGKFYYNGQWINTYVPTSNNNPYLKWEKKAEINIGTDFSLFSGKLSGTIDYYNRTISDLLYTYNVPTPPYLFSDLYTNVGSMRNSGIELTLSTNVIKKANVSWNTRITASHNQNKILHYTNGSFVNTTTKVGYVGGTIGAYTQRIQDGKSMGQFYGPQFIGVDALGHDTFKNANPVGTVNEDQWSALGSAYPVVQLGWSNTISYKRFSLGFTFRGNVGGHVLDTYRINYENWGSIGATNVMHTQLEHPAFTGNTQYSSKYLESGTYAKLDNVTLGYNFKITSAYFSRINAFATAQNVAWFTKYKGLDPEVSMLGIAPGIDGLSYYPRTTSITLGLTIGFN